MARTLQDVSLGGAAYFHEAWTQWHHGRLDATIEAADEAIRRLNAPVDAQRRIEMAGLRLLALHLAGRYEELEASVGDLSLGEVIRVADAVGHAGAIMCCDVADSVPAFQRSGDLPGFGIWLEGFIVRWAAAGPSR